MKKILKNDMIVIALENTPLKMLLLLTLLSCQLVNVKSQSKRKDSPYLTVKTRINKATSFYIESDSAITFSEFKSQLSEESSYHLENFEIAIKNYKTGRNITTLGLVLIPLGSIGDRLLWNNEVEKSYISSQGSSNQSSALYTYTTEGEPVYIGRIVSASIFLIGLIVRANAVTELKECVKEYNKFKIDVSPTYGLTKLNNQSVGFTLTVNF